MAGDPFVYFSTGTGCTTTYATSWSNSYYTWPPVDYYSLHYGPVAAEPRIEPPIEPRIEPRSERNEANERAWALLKEFLDEDQKREFEEGGTVTVVVGERRYQLWGSGLTRLIDEGGQVVERYCIHPVDSPPDGDRMLAQKLLLETDEVAFLAIAHVS